jgi:hypothetical protein
MSTVSHGLVEQRRVIDVNSVRGDLVAVQFEDVGEWNADHRAIMARISDLSLADCGRGVAPRAQQFVSAGRNGREKTRRGRVDGFMADDNRRIAKAKLRIRGEEGNKTSCVASVDDGENTLPPRAIGLKDRLGYYGNIHRIVGDIRVMDLRSRNCPTAEHTRCNDRVLMNKE